MSEASDEVLFLERIVKDEDGCWIWIGATDAQGRTAFPVAGVWIDARRAALKLFGKLPYAEVPVGCQMHNFCVNPDHLSTEEIRHAVDPDVMPQMTEEKISEFWALVDIGDSSDCWEWLGSRYPHGGYGRFRVWVSGDRFDGRRRAHRIALCLDTGLPYDTPRDALHSCDNPPCVNPAHLRWGSIEENIADARSRNRLGANRVHS